jgi:hypothetical protein
MLKEKQVRLAVARIRTVEGSEIAPDNFFNDAFLKEAIAVVVPLLRELANVVRWPWAKWALRSVAKGLEAYAAGLGV